MTVDIWGILRMFDMAVGLRWRRLECIRVEAGSPQSFWIMTEGYRIVGWIALPSFGIARGETRWHSCLWREHGASVDNIKKTTMISCIDTADFYSVQAQVDFLADC